jgi:hypothetical protein
MTLRGLTPALGVLVVAGLLMLVPVAVVVLAPGSYSHPAFSSGGNGVNLLAVAVVLALPVAGYVVGSYILHRERAPSTNR